MKIEQDYLSVTTLTKYLKRKFDADPYLGTIYLTGEISNFRPRANTHQYFSLKDEKAKISAVMFKGAYQKLKFEPEEGMKVLVVGRVSLYEASGSYQIYVERMEPDGVGALYQAYEQLKKELNQQGLFKVEHKQKLPLYPKKIAVITSPTGAVVKDIMTTIERRYPIAELVVFPTLVQGDKAAENIARRIRQVDELGGFDTMIVARGGGSIEDLWSFNTEEVVRAVFEARTPVISSVGHETDTTLTDLVADVRAATPTAAAELSVPVLQEELLKIKEKQMRLLTASSNQLVRKKERLDYLKSSIIFTQPNRLYEAFYMQLDQFSNRLNLATKGIINENNTKLVQDVARLKLCSPEDKVASYTQQHNFMEKQLHQGVSRMMEQNNNRLSKMIQALDILSPLKTMARGYSYVSKDSEIVSSVKDVSKEDKIEIHLVDGIVKARIE